MKISNGILSDFLAAALIAFSAVPVSCNKLPSENTQGFLSWNYAEPVLTRSLLDLPDTDAFILTVKNVSGDVLYEGAYGSSPVSMLVNPGNYTVKVVSRVLEKPEFSAPVFGDEQVAVVQSGSQARVLLRCSQLNSGLRFRMGSDFISTYPGGFLTVSSSEGGLRYTLSENRAGYFNPGLVSVSLNDGKNESQLMSRFLEPCEILTIGLSCPSPEGGEQTEASGFSISVDTTRVWNDDDYVVGSTQGNASGTSQSCAYGISAAKSHIGEKDVWVCGYVVGGDLSSTKNGIVFEPPFNSLTNIAIASRSSVTDKSACMSVQLNKGDIRSALNLVDHPELLGKKIYLKGDVIDAYYGIPGVQNVTDYSIKQ